MDPIHIYFENESIIICEKPAGVSSEDGGLPDLLCKQKGIDKVYTVHRLDKMVTGGIMYAKTKEAASAISSQIADGVFHKSYIAAAEGKPENEEGTWEDLLFFDRKQGKSYIVQKERRGVKKAIMTYRYRGEFKTESGKTVSFVEIELVTGRTHQIRAQLASRKHPVLGDRRYGSREDIGGIALRSYKMVFNDPDTGEEQRYVFPLPDRYPWNNLTQIK